MIGKKIGNFTQVFNQNSELNNYILRGLFEKDLALGGEISGDLSSDFLVKVTKGVNYIMIKSLDNWRLSIQLSILTKNNITHPDGKKKMSSLIGKDTFVIDYKKPGLPVYNSEY